jgi:hypothetical protein
MLKIKNMLTHSNTNPNEKFLKFLDSLYVEKGKKNIKLLYRGVNKIKTFNRLGLDVKNNNIKQFAEKLFFFGEKSRYYWNDRLDSTNFDFDINDVSEQMFKYIFLRFNELILKSNKVGTINFLYKNKNATTFFKNLSNVKAFTEISNLFSVNEKQKFRNYYLSLLHQLGDPISRNNSLFVSSSSRKEEAEKFSKNDIIIKFWIPSFSNFNNKNSKEFPIFVGKPYKNQKEISIFSSIFPQFIYSFKYKQIDYINPALSKVQNNELTILSGFDIKQENFIRKLKNETNYESGVITIGITYKKSKL